jgi:predicted metal-binding membrane protein
MSITWMAVVAALIALEKTLPYRRVATYTTTAVLLVAGLLLLIAPGALPGLTQPAVGGMPTMGM